MNTHFRKHKTPTETQNRYITAKFNDQQSTANGKINEDLKAITALHVAVVCH